MFPNVSKTGKKRVKTSKTSNSYYCECCDYNTSRKNNWQRHLLSKRHKKKCNQNVTFCNQNEQKNEQKRADVYFCRDCGKTYKSRMGLWRHKKKCQKSIEKGTKKRVPIGIDEEIKLMDTKQLVDYAKINTYR